MPGNTGRFAKRWRLPVLLALLACPSIAAAGPAEETVRAMYLPKVQTTVSPALRGRFVDPARSQLDRNDDLAKSGDIGCIDWNLASDSQDFEQATVKRTLKLSEKVNGNTAQVTARFKVFSGGDESRIVWSLKRVGSEWKVADIASLTSDWRLSELDCSGAPATREEGEGAE